MANTNTLLAPTPKDRAVTTTDPVKEAAQPPGAAAADRHSRTAQTYAGERGRGCPRLRILAGARLPGRFSRSGLAASGSRSAIERDLSTPSGADLQNSRSDRRAEGVLLLRLECPDMRAPILKLQCLQIRD